jgi:hypothetical protein
MQDASIVQEPSTTPSQVKTDDLLRKTDPRGGDVRSDATITARHRLGRHRP